MLCYYLAMDEATAYALAELRHLHKSMNLGSMQNSDKIVLADLVDPPTLEYRRDPVRWLSERVKVETWSKQKQIIEAVRDYKQVAIKSCHSAGKSFTAAAVAAWWLDTHPVGEARVITTAPTQPQVAAILWNEIAKFHDIGGLGGRLNLTEWYFGNYLAGIGRKPSEHTPTAFQGLHARYLLVILDEAYGIPKTLWDAASTLASNENSRIMVIGNPDGPSEFMEVCKPDSGWHVIKIAAEDTPNFTGEMVSQRLKDMLIHPDWVNERAKKWGTKSALYQSKIDGEFPTGGDPYACIPFDWLMNCKTLDIPAGMPHEAGIDVGAGGDRTVIWERTGLRAGRHREFVNPDPKQTAGDLNLTMAEWGITKAKVDSTGIGWGLVELLKQASSKHAPNGPRIHNSEIIGINFGAGPTPGYEKKYLNKRAEIWWSGRERCRPDVETWDLSEVDDDVIAELNAPKYEIMDSFGKIKIESKKDVIKRLGYSPDNADALLLAFLETTTMAGIGGGMADANLSGLNHRQRW